jgi:hypothetical protein
LRSRVRNSKISGQGASANIRSKTKVKIISTTGHSASKGVNKKKYPLPSPQKPFPKATV